VGTANGAGGTYILYGSATGLKSQGYQFWSQDSTGIQGIAESGDRFGASMAAGDFDNDGYIDLSIGTPGQDHSVPF
jgi:FG-GAP repeat